MSIFIPGMEMPRKGKSVCIEIFGDGSVHRFGECYPCALAYEVKAPHGRLIDADALEDNAITYYATPIGEVGGVDLVLRVSDVDAAETVIEAEGGGEDG